MRVENHVYPTRAHLAALVATGGEGPVVMVNLLKFRPQAVYDEGSTEVVSGREAYMRYAVAMTAIVQEAGGRVVVSTDVTGLVIGEVEDLWDAVVLVEYPSAAVFVALVTSPEVMEIARHRTAGLAGQLLLRSKLG